MSRLGLLSISPVLCGIVALPIGCSDDKTSTAPTTVASLVGVPCQSDAQCADLQTTACQIAVCGDSGVCAIAPVPDGTSCSTGAVCVENQTCVAGTCGGGAAPAADCGDKVCGQDACGSSCGRCQDNYECTAAGQCEEIVDPCMGLTFAGCCTGDGRALWCEAGALAEQDCASGGAACGWREDVGYYFCTGGDEAPSPNASLPYLCPDETCASQDPCGDRECGYQCGQSCGKCDEGSVCGDDGTCGVDVCGDLTFTGCCTGTLSYYCDAGVVKVLDCSGGDPASCGWDGGEGFYDCEQTGADPSGAYPIDCKDYTFVVPE